ncbi:MAG: hypothetical protein WAW39_18815, partial [Prosthecobacter sp.]|uniref:beta strand repeat-containing protein n=1 Tax=Prosthecobacter sp. TaxID=1965333 RepID=UPI003BB0CE2C
MTRLFIWIYALLFVLPVQAGMLSGTYAVGPGGDYASIGEALSAIQTNGLSGPMVLELQASYVSTGETFPLVFTNLGTTATNTLTLRPQAGAAALSISSADATAATVDLNGAQFVTIDGRAGGVGTVKQLTIANTSTSGVALRFINEAGGNVIQYITLRGVNTSATSGTVLFSTTTGANGNDNNTLDHCDICAGATKPTNGLYALGTTTTSAQTNSGNTVSNCNIFNFHATTSVDSAGVRLDGGNTDWILTYNSFYQTASRTGVGAFVRPIYINNPSGNNFSVTGNFIGGSATGAAGAAWTTPPTGAGYQFAGIHLNVGVATPSSVQGNTIQNIVWMSGSTASSLPGVWNGIYVQSGAADLGSNLGNTVGSGSGTGSVTVSTSGAGGFAYGIGSNSSASITISNNAVGSITMNGANVSTPTSLVGIHVTNGENTINTISNNVVGSTTTANSLNAATATTYSISYSQRVTGILSYNSGSSLIAGNTVANLNNNSMQTSYGFGQVGGIVVLNGINSIVGNSVHDLSTTSPNPNASTAQSVYGIAVITSGFCGHTVSQNTVHSLANTSATAAVGVTGIYFTSGYYGSNANFITRNRVHSLAVSSSSAAASMNGMSCDISAKGGAIVTNNMVCVGLKADGTSTAGAAIVRGIYDNGTDAGRNFYHNSIYVGGTQTSGASSSYAFCSTGVSNQRTFQNNILVNDRGNNGATGRHYAVSYGGTVVDPTGLAAGGNIFLASGTGGMLGSYNSADIAALDAWQAATGQDATSAVTAPFFINPTGTASTVDLHLQASNPAEGGGIPIAFVTDDYDGQVRGELTPTDIGADAGNFTLSSDVLAPGISYPLLSNGSTASRVLSGWATITDGSGVASGASAPRLYFKKASDDDAFGVPNDASGNGWKYTTATGNSPYHFIMDYTL